jgi:hypothetical protein
VSWPIQENARLSSARAVDGFINDWKTINVMQASSKNHLFGNAIVKDLVRLSHYAASQSIFPHWAPAPDKNPSA